MIKLKTYPNNIVRINIMDKACYSKNGNTKYR